MCSFLYVKKKKTNRSTDIQSKSIYKMGESVVDSLVCLTGMCLRKCLFPSHYLYIICHCAHVAKLLGPNEGHPIFWWAYKIMMSYFLSRQCMWYIQVPHPTRTSEMNWCFSQCQLANDKTDDENLGIFSSKMSTAVLTTQQ